MTAIAGICGSINADRLSRAAASMIAAQLQYGPHRQDASTLVEAVFGRALYRLLPEDKFDRQPLVDPSGRWMLVADIRLDNREELLDLLGLSKATPESDSALLSFAWDRWGEAALDRLVGDFAFAVWDAREKALTLVRDPAGQRPLHFHRNESFVAFASMPQGLHSLPEVGRRLDREQLAVFVADLHRQGRSTYFEGINRVEPGERVTITRAGSTSRRYWEMPTREIRFAKETDYLEAFREQLDRATRARLRGAKDLVGAHLSAGLDSTAVASTAAKLFAPSGGRIVAFTSAPRMGFAGRLPHARIGDESAFAATVAARYANMDHVIIRPDGVSAVDAVGRHNEAFQEPVGHPCNIVWWSAVHEQARARGISMMLTGEAGNLTTSAGGLGVLADFVGRGRLLRWWTEARSIARTGQGWRGLMAVSFGPWVPSPILHLLSRAVGSQVGVPGTRLLGPALQSLLASQPARAAYSDNFPKNNRKHRWMLMQQHEPGNFRKGVLAEWGVDERDPTADRRLAEFCLAVPPEVLLGGGLTRRLARKGLVDRLPVEVLHAPRGYQYADWYEGIDRLQLSRELARLERGPAASLLDFTALWKDVEDWPDTGWEQMSNIARFRVGFLKALSAASFANWAESTGSGKLG